MLHLVRACATIVLSALLFVAFTPSFARAHAAFVSSEPEPGAELSSAPGVVVLRFSEPLITRLSSATVTDPSGRSFPGEVAGERELRVRLATNAPGVYDVEWKTVSPVDGHSLAGVFRFGVGVSPGEGAEGETGADPTRGDLLLAVARAVEYAALLLALGMLLIRRLARRRPALDWVNPRIRAAIALALIAGVVVVSGETLLAAGSLLGGAVAAFLGSGLAGVARVVRLGAEAVAMVLAARRRSPAPFVALAIGALAAAGHAPAVAPRWWGITADLGHLLAAGLWAGGIMSLATLRPPGGWRSEEGRRLLNRFTRVALPSFVLTIGFGVIRGAQELTGFSDLVDTSYGRVVGLKIIGVLVMVPLSVLMWLRIGRTPRSEALIAVVVIGAAAALAAYPLPPARLGEAEAAEAPPAPSSALPRAGDLTLGGDAGEVLLGLTVRPAEPGLNEMFVYVLPLEGQEAAGRIPVRLSVGGEGTLMDDCGPTCRRAEVELRGGEAVEVRADIPEGGSEVFHLPELPTDRKSVV